MINKKNIFLVPSFLFLCFFISAIIFIFSRKDSFDFDYPEELNFSITPEYERNLKELTLTIPKKTASEEETFTLLKNTYSNLLLNIPPYTKLAIFTHTENKSILQKFFLELKVSNEIVYTFSNNNYLEIWAQDFFEPASSSSLQYLLLPMTTDKSPAFKRIEQRTSSFKSLPKAVTMPFFFEGGNFLAAKSSSGNFIFIDFETIKKTQDLYRLNNKKTSYAQIKNIVQKTFPSSTVVVLGDRMRKDNFIHLDQSVLFLDDNIVVLNSINDDTSSKAASQHKLYKKQLENLGFETKILLIPLDEVKNSMSSLNALVFRNSITKQKSILFPVYPNQVENSVKQKSSLKKDDLQGTALKAFMLFSDAGYLPIPVFDSELFKKGGSLHCISNITR